MCGGFPRVVRYGIGKNVAGFLRWGRGENGEHELCFVEVLIHVRCELRMWVVSLAGDFGEFAEPIALDPLKVASGLCLATFCQSWLCHSGPHPSQGKRK